MRLNEDVSFLGGTLYAEEEDEIKKRTSPPKEGIFTRKVSIEHS